MSMRLSCFTLLSALGVLVATPPRPAAACGGLFCDASNPVNQAAERIIFADNGDGSVTALIEIQYEGPSDRFAWVLPVPGVPEVDVSSTLALDRLQSVTNPQYNLSTVFECDGDGDSAGGGTRAPGQAAGDNGTDEPGVIVLAADTVGPFDYQVISVNPDLPEPGDAAVEWLTNEGYDLMDIGPERLAPYLEDGLNLIAFRLTKDANSGSIRPIVITYDADVPFIPIRPTAVAATEDMGIMVWVLGGDRAIPKNYKHLELNEALIDWFNPNDTYNDVVSAAADEAGGQGFVTEMASPTSMLDQQVVYDWERESWASVSSASWTDGYELLFEGVTQFSEWDGFQDALTAAVTLPADVTLADFLDCPGCYRNNPELVIDQDTLLQQVWDKVVRPMFDTQDLVDASDYFTRVYTTMSPDEMTVDPSFDFNPELEDVDNVHVATQYLRCDSDEWRIELPQGGVVHGSEQGVWPIDIDDQPATLKILQLSTSGQGEMVEDNTDRIVELLSATGPQGGAGGTGGGGAPAVDGGVTSDSDEESSHNICGCRVPGGRGARTTAPLLGLLAVVGLVLRRRRRAPARES